MLCPRLCQCVMLVHMFLLSNVFMLCVFILCVCVCEGFYCVTVYVYLSVCLLWATMPEIK